MSDHGSSDPTDLLQQEGSLPETSPVTALAEDIPTTSTTVTGVGTTPPFGDQAVQEAEITASTQAPQATQPMTQGPVHSTQNVSFVQNVSSAPTGTVRPTRLSSNRLPLTIRDQDDAALFTPSAVDRLTSTVQRLTIKNDSLREDNEELRDKVRIASNDFARLEQLIMDLRNQPPQAAPTQAGSQTPPGQASPSNPSQGSNFQPTNRNQRLNDAVTEAGADPTPPYGGSSHRSSRRSSHHTSTLSRQSRRGAQPPGGPPSSSSPTSSSSSSSPSEDEEKSASSSDDYVSSQRRRRSRRKSSHRRLSMHFRKKGPKHPGLRELKPTNPRYDKVLSYRSYRLENISSKRNTRGTATAKRAISKMELKLKEHHFSGNDPIMVIDFLTRLVREANIQGFSEAQMFLALPAFLEGKALSHYESGIEFVPPEEGGVSCWPEAVQYFLRSYAGNQNISAAEKDLRATQQKDDEEERDFATRMNKAVTRCGNVHSQFDVITMFVDGLHSSISPLVARFRESTRNASYLQVVDYAQSEGEAYRARLGTGVVGPSTIKRQTMTTPGRSSIPQDRAKTISVRRNQRNVLAIEAPPMELPTEVEIYTEGEEDEVLMVGGKYYQQMRPRPQPTVPPPKVPHLTTTTSRPGWVDPTVRPRPAGNSGQARPPPIGYECYEVGTHISPHCKLGLRDLKTVLINYDKLTAEQRTQAPPKSYLRARKFLELEEEMSHQSGVVATIDLVNPPHQEMDQISQETLAITAPSENSSQRELPAGDEKSGNV